MATIPIRKLNDGSTNYYPLSVGESTVISHDIVVTQNIGDFKKGTLVPAVTTIDTILTKLLTGDNPANITIDNKTINTDDSGQLQVNIDNDTLQYDEVDDTIKVSGNVARLDKDQKFEGNNTFAKSITILNNELPSAVKSVRDNFKFSRFKASTVNPDEMDELPDSGEISSGTYHLSKNRNEGIIIAEGADVELYIDENVIVSSSTSDGLYIKNGAVLRLYNSGTIKCLHSNGQYCTIYNEGTAYINGGNYERSDGKANIYYYTVLNHGKLLEFWNATIKKNYSPANSSTIVTGYQIYEVGNNRSYINSSVGSKTPKTVIHSGNYSTQNSTGVLKNDEGGTLIVYDGDFTSPGYCILQNCGLKTEIHGGLWHSSDVPPTTLILTFNNADTIITGGTFAFSGSSWLIIDENGKLPKISGGVFGPVTSYLMNNKEVTNFDNLVDTGCIAVKKNSNIYVYYTKDIEASLNGIKFEDGSIFSTGDGLYIKNVKDINDPNSAVSKAYVDSKETPVDNETIVKNDSGQIEVNANVVDICMTTFEVIACSEDKTIHELLPDNKRYNKEPIYDLEGNIIYHSTRDIKGNGMIHEFLLRTSLENEEEDSILNSDVTVDWGDGSKEKVSDIYKKWKDTADYTKWFDLQYKTNLLNSESEANVQFCHEYENEGVYIVKVIGTKFFGIRNGDKIKANTSVPSNKSLLSRAYDDDLLIAKNHVNHTNFCAYSPLLTEVYISTRIEFPAVHNQTSNFAYCDNLVTALGFRDKFRGVYSQSSVFQNCKSLLLTDCKIKNVPGYTSAFNSMYVNCTNLGKKFFNIETGIVIDSAKILGQSTTSPTNRVTINGIVVTQFEEGNIVYYLNGSKWDKRGVIYRYENGKWKTVGNVCWNYADDFFPYTGLVVTQKLDFNSVFTNCKSLTIKDYDYLSRMLWNNPITRFSATSQSFSGCSSMNLDKIPKSWGGKGENVATTIDISTDDGIVNAVKLILMRCGFDESKITM